MIRTSDVFGIRTTISEHSYVDRGNLDESLRELARQDQLIALKGESKSGKSWLRQKAFPNANIIQCRIHDSVATIYRQILANLKIAVSVENASGTGGTATFEGTAEVGWSFLAKASGRVEGTIEGYTEKVTRPVGRDELDIEFIADIIKTSERRVIIEDFHYLPHEAQRELSHELKTLWDYGVYLVVVGIWHRKNYLIYLNSDLAGRIAELNVEWTASELSQSLDKGCAALNVYIDKDIVSQAAADSYNNIGILQSIALRLLDACGVHEEQSKTFEVCDAGKLEDAGMAYADQLEAVYSLFADRVSDGIRKRKDATQIYAFALWSIMESTDEEAKAGLTVDWIYTRAHERQPRIQKPNLRSVLRKFKELQVDDRGKGLVLSFDEANDIVIVIDKALLFYRKYTTQAWPWEKIALEAQAANVGIDAKS